MITKIEIILESTSESYKRTASMNGETMFSDERSLNSSFPGDDDPIRQLELFLIGEKPQRLNDGSCNLRYSTDTFKNRLVRGFGKLLKLVSKFLNIRAK